MKTSPFFVQKQTQNGQTTLVAVEYTLTQKDINPETDLVLYVDTLTIPAGRLRLKSKNITIYSRKIIFDKGGILDTSGEDITARLQPENQPRADSGAGSGHSGKNGSHGLNGKNGGAAGNITIHAGAIKGTMHLIAVGGKGQQGQNGQDGGHGIRGRDGVDASVNVIPKTFPTGGESGGNAGNGGNAGRSGDGGAGGAIFVMLATSISQQDAVIFENRGGEPGNPATPGRHGNRGEAGIGGRFGISRPKALHNHALSNTRLPSSHRDGAYGRDGEIAVPALQGNNGRADISGAVNPGNLFVKDTSMLAMLTLTMHFAEVAYLSGKFDEAIAYYEWVAGLTSAVTGTTGLPGEFSAINRQSRALLSQLSQGLDFFANPMSYVPIAALYYYETAIDSMLLTGGQIESVYTAYTTFLASETREFTRMGDAIAQAGEAIKTYKNIQDGWEKQIKDLVPVINHLGNALIVQYQVLLNADDAFKKAVEATQICTFTGLLALLRTIVGVGQSVFAAWKNPSIKSLVTAGRDLVNLGINIENGKIVENPQAIQGNPQDVTAAWKAINPGGSSDVGDDKKLIVLREEFDEMIKPYLSLPEAVEYRKQIHDYIGIVQARNAKLLEYTNAAIQYAALIGTIAQKQKELKRIEAQMAREHVHGLISYRNFLFNLYNDFKSFVLKYLYQENRAFVYWSHKPNEFVIKHNSFIALGQLHANIKAAILKHLNGGSNPSQPIKDMKIELTEAGREQQFADFKATHKITFNINIHDDYFPGLANVMLTNFRIYLKGPGLDDSGFYIRLLHHGSVLVIDPVDQVHEYTHSQVLSFFDYRVENGKPVTNSGGALGGDNTGSNFRRIALSPYATFTIELPARFNRNRNLNLENLERIDIHFVGYGETPAKLSKRALRQESGVVS